MSGPAPGHEGGGGQRRVRLGRYDLIAQLGSGGMADVYLGVVRGPAGFNKLVVLKVLRAQFSHDTEFLKMFLDEARLSARFNHPNVVQTYEVEEDQGRCFLVMEYLEGHPLADLEASHGEMPLPMSVRVLVDILSGLHYAHELTDLHGEGLGIVHRDVSPQNVFVTYDGPAKMLDFGVAKARNALSQTQDGAIKGKVRYMAPEQVSGEGVDRRADVFAAGILLWRAATGKKLWEGYDQLSIMHRLVNGEPVPSPRSIRPEVPRAIDAICVKALALRPEDRFATAAEFGAALEEVLHGAGAQGSHRAVARYLEERYAPARAKFQAFVDERLRALEGLPLDRASSFGGLGGESRRWQLPSFFDDEKSGGGSTGRAVVTSAPPPSFGALSDFPAPLSTGRPPVGVRPSQAPSASVAGAARPVQRPQRSKPWPLFFAVGGLGLGALALLAPLALRYVSQPEGPPGAGAAFDPSPGVSSVASAAPAVSVRAAAPTARASAEASAEPLDGRDAPDATGEARAVPGGGHGVRGAGPRKGPRHGASATPPGGPAETAEKKEPAPVKTETPANDPCLSPYFIDERGVKKIKPECL